MKRTIDGSVVESTSSQIVEPASTYVHPRSGDIISCTRRGDVPANMMDWLIESITKGYVDVPNPRNSKCVSRVDLSPNVVRCWAWWSKDYANWIARWNTENGHHLLNSYDLHLFNFTINGEGHSVLEPGLETTLAQRLDQLRWLATNFSPRNIILRFDPIVHYRILSQGQTVHDNTEHFEEIMIAAQSVGIHSVAIAMVNQYVTVVRRMRNRGMEFVSMTKEQKETEVRRLVEIAGAHEIELLACSQPEISDIEDVGTSTCIDGNLISELLVAKGKAPLSHPNTRDRGGRYPKCHCTKSVEIGGYVACKHSCAYCYANPAQM